MREMTFASNFLILSALLAVCIFAWGHWRLKGTNGAVPQGRLYRRLSPLMLVMGVFVGVLSALYAVPLLGILVELISEFFTFKWINGLYWGGGFVFAFLAMMFFLATMFVFIIFPLYVTVCYPSLWRKVGEASSKVIPKPSFLGYALGFALVWVGIHGLSSLQPNVNYVSQLEAMPAAERQELVTKSGKVKRSVCLYR